MKVVEETIKLRGDRDTTVFIRLTPMGIFLMFIDC